MRFHSKRVAQMQDMYEEEEMLKYASHLLYDTELDIDSVVSRFVEQFGEENRHIIDEILNEA